MKKITIVWLVLVAFAMAQSIVGSANFEESSLTQYNEHNNHLHDKDGEL